MRYRAALGLVVAVATSVSTGAGAAPSSSPTPAPRARFAPGEVLIGFTGGARAHRLALAAVHGRRAGRIPILGIERLMLGAGVTPSVAAAKLRGLPGVRFAEPNLTGSIQTAELLPDDRCFEIGCGIGRMWNLDAINAPAGWATFPGRFYDQSAKASFAPVKVAVLDTAIDRGRSDWRNADAGSTNEPHDARNGGQLDLADAANLVTNGMLEGPAAWHGTFVAGLIGAAANNGTDVAGVGYHAQLMPVTVVDGDGATNAFDLANGIAHAIARGAKVINLSLGMSGDAQTVHDAITLAARTAVLVAAAGNNGNTNDFYPAAYPGVMAVAASTITDRLASCSNYGPKISVAAPGATIIGLDPRDPGGVSVVGCGTSTAAPHVAGLAALLFAQDPTRSADEVRRIIEDTADDDAFQPGRDERFGAGRINVERALRVEQDRAMVTRILASVPPAQGGVATIAALTRASGPILAAEWYLDRIGASSTAHPLRAADGDLDEPIEQLTGIYTVSPSLPEGVHRIFLRARTAAGWGASSTGVLIIDRTAPGVVVTGDPPNVAVPAAGLPASISLRVTDDTALTGSMRFVVRRAHTGDGIVHESAPQTISFPSDISAEWLPAPLSAGTYRIEILVTDEAGNQASVQADVIVVG